MQSNAVDYYIDEWNSGCCLTCSDSYDGCLCFNCKCTKCYWYNTKGKCCDKVSDLKEKRFKRYMERFKGNFVSYVNPPPRQINQGKKIKKFTPTPLSKDQSALKEFKNVK